MRGPVTLAALLALALAQPALARPPSEAAVKAELVDRFVLYITWPDHALPEADRPLVIGVVGKGATGAQLQKLARSRRMKGHPITVHAIEDLSQLARCHIVFVEASARDRLADVLRATRNRPILTVGDSAGFGAKGVMINIYRHRGKLRFEINRRSARASGLTFSSKLLRLGKLVGEET